MSGRNVILHYHIFKNAGTSFNKALELAFGDAYIEFDGEQASNAFEPQQIAKIIRENPTKRAFSTHQGMLPLPQMEEGEVFGTLLLRHPLARISSIYHFERKQESQSMGAMKAKELSFGDYLRWRWEQSPAFFCFQALFCARTVEHRGYKPLETILQRARKNLEQVHCVGTVENYPQFLVNAQSLLERMGVEHQLAAFHANATESAGPDHAGIFTRILQETDQEFWDAIAPFIAIDTDLWSMYHHHPSNNHPN